MRKILYGIRFLKTFLKLGIRKCFGMLHIQYKFTNAVSGSATVKTTNGGEISFGSVIQIRPNAEISANGGKIVLEGKNYVNRNTMIVSHEAITIGEGTTIGPNCCIYDHDHQLYPGGGYKSEPIIIGSNVWIGAGTIILRGVKIGDNSVIGAGAVITRDVPSNCIAVQKRNTEIVC